MSLTTSSFFKKKSVPLDTFTGTRTASASTMAGAKIFKLPNHPTRKKKTSLKRKHLQLWVLLITDFSRNY